MTRIADLTAAVLCEDARVEDNGKIMLLGVYSGNIIFGSFPATIALRLYIAGAILTPEGGQLNFHWKLNGNEVGIAKGAVAPDGDSRDFATVLPPMFMTVEAPGILEVTRSDTGEPVLTKGIEQGSVRPRF